MTASHHEQLVEIFQAVCDLEPARRSARLDELCGENLELRTEVEALLARDTEVTDFLARPVLETPMEAVLADQAQRILGSTPDQDDDASSVMAIGRRFCKHLGGFEILRLLGEGAMGLVFLAREDHPPRTVAIKLVRPGIATRKMIARFEHETAILGRLQHPGIAQIHEAGTTDTGDGVQPYFVMEYVEGRPLLNYADDDSLGTRDRLALLVKVCEAVHHAHQKGIVHRDLKPDNILVTGDGQPKVLDFGVARITDSDVQTTTLRTDIGQLIGTVPYMSPEQARGDSRELDIRSDVYALGVLGFELLSGQLPYDLKGRKIHEAIRIIQDADPLRLSTIDRTLRGDVETIVAKALEKDRDRRYASAAGFAQDIERYLHEEPIAARPASSIYQIRKFARRNRLLVGCLAVVFVVLAAASAISSIFAIRADRDRGQAIEDRNAAQWQAYRGSLDAASAALDDQLYSTAVQKLNLVPGHLRNWEWDYLSSRTDASLITIDAHQEAINDLAISPDGRLLASASDDETIKLWNGATLELLHTLKGHTFPVQCVTFSPGGRRLASGAQDTTLRIWDADTGRAIAEWQHWDPNTMCLAFSPDGRYIASGVGQGALLLLDAETGEIIRTFQENILDHAVSAVAFSPDGSKIVSGSRQGGLDQGGVIRLWDAASGRHLAAAEGHTSYVESVMFSHDGKRVISASRDTTIRHWDGDTLEELATFDDHTMWIHDACLTSDGTRLVSASSDKTIRITDAETLEPLSVLHGHATCVDSVVCALDQSRIVSGSGSGILKVWAFPSKEDEDVRIEHDDVVHGITFSPDGSRFVTGSYDGTLKIWNADTYRVLATLKGHEHWVLSVAWSPDGSRILSGSADGTIRIWNAETGLLDSMHLAHGHYVNCIAWSRDGRRFASASWDGRIKVWEAETGAELLMIDSYVRTLEVLDDGTNKMSLPPGTEIPDRSSWLMNDIARLKALEDFGKVNSVVFSHDGSRLISGGDDGYVRIWDLTSGHELLSMSGHEDKIYCIALSPDGRLIASASYDKTIRIWDTETGAWQMTLTGHDDWALFVGFTRDGTRIATGSIDNTIKMWDVVSGAEVLTLRGHTGFVQSIAFSPDTMTMVSAAWDRSVRIWNRYHFRERLRRRSVDRALVEARPIVDRLLLADLEPGEVAGRLRGDVTLTEPVRRAALNHLLASSDPDDEQQPTGPERGSARRVGWWPGEGNADDVEGGHDGTLLGGAGFAPGLVGQAFRLDGIDDRIGEIGTPGSYSFIHNTGVFSIVAWIRIDDPGVRRNKQQIVNTTGPDRQGKGIQFYFDNLYGEQRLAFCLVRDCVSRLHCLHTATTSWQIITDRHWHHVAVVGDGRSIVFHVDGVTHEAVYEAFNLPLPIMLGIGDAASRFGIGGYVSKCRGRTFGGLIDELAIYAGPLSEAEISTLYGAADASP